MLLYTIAVLVLCFSHISATPARVPKRFIGNGGQTASGTPLQTNQSYLTPARLNIIDIEKDPLQWSLWIQSLIRMQSAPDSSYISYYQLAGVHGRPYIPWNNVEQAPGAPKTGYCEHGSVLFLPWHRPYLALYEDVLAAHAQDIVDSYSNASKSTWQTAADLFRIPYWDWGTSPEIPDVMLLPTLQIAVESGNKTVDNPLYQYKFHNFPLNATEFPPNEDYFLANRSTTVRGLDRIGGASDIDHSNEWLVSSDLMRNTWFALTKPQSFNEFGTTATHGASLEAIHNTVHGCVGGSYGHMTIFSYSAFDPIFWLHHANVDRLFALWQAINPDSYVMQMQESTGTFAIASNTLVNASTPLEPWSVGGEGPFYTSDSCRSLNAFSYTYPELRGVPANQLKSSVSAHINNLYNPSGTFTKRDDIQNEAAYAPGAQVREWAVGLGVNKNDLYGDRFIIRVFLGDVPVNSRDWAATDNLAGSFSVFPPPSDPNGSFPEILAYSEVNLVKALAENGVDGSDIHGVRKYLKHNLKWRVQKFDGAIVPIEQVPSLTLTIEDSVVTLGNDITELPTYGTKTLHPDITEYKSGAQ